MSYNKPELVVSGSSVELIQGSTDTSTKHQQTYPDNRNSQELDATMGAYEADE
jgi:hypothetical protein